MMNYCFALLWLASYVWNKFIVMLICTLVHDIKFLLATAKIYKLKLLKGGGA